MGSRELLIRLVALCGDQFNHRLLFYEGIIRYFRTNAQQKVLEVRFADDLKLALIIDGLVINVHLVVLFLHLVLLKERFLDFDAVFYCVIDRLESPNQIFYQTHHILLVLDHKVNRSSVTEQKSEAFPGKERGLLDRRDFFVVFVYEFGAFLFLVHGILDVLANDVLSVQPEAR